MSKSLAEKYIRQNGRKLPIEKCLVSDGYDDGLHTLALIIRKQPSNYLSFAYFMIDRHCLGIKNTMVNCNVSYTVIQELIDKSEANIGPMKEVGPGYFHNLVYGALDYAESIGFEPNKDFAIAQYLLTPDLVDYGIDDLEFGKDGKPYFMAGPDDNVPKIIGTLNRNVGEGNYNFTVPTQEF